MQKSLYSDSYKIFLRHLQQSRKDSGLTQEELAHRLACTQSFVSKCERGERRLDIIEVRKICKALGVPFLQFAEELDKRLTEQDD